MISYKIWRGIMNLNKKRNMIILFLLAISISTMGCGTSTANHSKTKDDMSSNVSPKAEITSNTSIASDVTTTSTSSTAKNTIQIKNTSKLINTTPPTPRRTTTPAKTSINPTAKISLNPPMIRTDVVHVKLQKNETVFDAELEKYLNTEKSMSCFIPNYDTMTFYVGTVYCTRNTIKIIKSKYSIGCDPINPGDMYACDLEETYTGTITDTGRGCRQ